ncbi:unnamed protein product [Medioppia subpectinata]|uniref:Helicase ATP-binding domain-containing protein n=1 Tax=Medioppia subpectinata TaxID=1979941 RepID=A0A7R9KJT9_9ACAR|nr:unnamed protein product [Medioppia subpectinata]CAG2104848.1 unnamed protein product [Medioppia subpectinata]
MSSSGYHFPYIAYDIQEQLMDAMYGALDEQKMAILESPTGTGKSLSIICATIKWIHDFHDKQLDTLSRQLKRCDEEIQRLDAESKVSSDWIELQDKKSSVCRQKEVIVKQLTAFEAKDKRNKSLLDRRNNSIVRQKFVLKHKNVTKKLKKSDTNGDQELDPLSGDGVDEDFVDYCSDDEVVDEKSSEVGDGFVAPKMYYCSRTHSQLSQFIRIICATIKWIHDFHDKQLDTLSRQLKRCDEEIQRLDAESKVSSDWIELQDKKSSVCRQKEVIVKQLTAFEAKDKRNKLLLDRRNNSIVRQKFVLKHKNVTKKAKTSDTNGDQELDPLSGDGVDEDFVDYCSDDEVVDEKSSEVGDGFVAPKMYYCSRTHSQLSQFIREIQKTAYSREETPLRLVPLGSRSNYCINERVLRLNNNNLINEKCIELQNSSNSQLKCQMFKHNVINELRDEVLADVLDIEDITKLGKGIKACPYYSTRLAIPEAEIVILPYNILLHSATRESYGINLKGSVVVIDEAHNLMETIHNIHSIELKGSHIIDTLSQLNAYLMRYKSRLSARNTMHIKQIAFILNEFIKHFKASAQIGGHNVSERVEFLIRLGIENLNLYQILDYCQKSQIARKLFGFSKRKNCVKIDEKSEKKANGTTAFLAKMKGKSIEVQAIASNDSAADEETKIFGSPLYIIIEFLKALIDSKANAKIITNFDTNSLRNSCVKYILLNPFSQFKDIVSECRSVVLCGGTMKPFDEYIDHLFKPLGITSERLVTFSCGHVIPDSNLSAICLGMGPNGRQLNYTFQNRTNTSMIEETGKTIANMCAVIPDGIVCFFPSYDFEDNYYKVWQKSGIIKSIEAKGKTVFREPRKSSMVQTILGDYNRAITPVLFFPRYEYTQQPPFYSLP